MSPQFRNDILVLLNAIHPIPLSDAVRGAARRVRCAIVMHEVGGPQLDEEDIRAAEEADRHRRAVAACLEAGLATLERTQRSLVDLVNTIEFAMQTIEAEPVLEPPAFEQLEQLAADPTRRRS